ncbi:MAG: exonuclease domain-containing protein [Ruminiclostridium sp.]|nr:exonuclease domain-containing protein [Ruminiclostridium sp.]
MNYIIFDMEWNQPSSAKEKNPSLVRGEIIQLGFFVLNEELDVLHKENILIRPVCYKCINQYVGYLTGISQEMLDAGVDFRTALKRISEFFSDDTLLFTWGDDDIPILNENMKFHKIEMKLPKHYNLQRFYAHQTGSETRQTALKTAAEYFGIEKDIQAHDALNDAFITLLVARKLDIAKGIADYNKAIVTSKSKQKNIWDSEKLCYSCEQEYTKVIGALPDTCRSISIPCSDCGAEIIYSNLCRYGKNSFITVAECVCTSRYFVHFEMKSNILTIKAYELSEKTEKFYQGKIQAKEARKKYYQAKNKRR